MDRTRSKKLKMAEQDFENEEIFDEKAEDRPKFSLQTLNDEICCGDCVLKKEALILGVTILFLRQGLVQKTRLLSNLRAHLQIQVPIDMLSKSVIGLFQCML